MVYQKDACMKKEVEHEKQNRNFSQFNYFFNILY
jgi:hypothetical protein